jgi:hypothetical protein
MRWPILFRAFLIILASTSIGLANTVHVPGDQPTIQAGIDVASAEDTVLVADGVFTGEGNKNLDCAGKSLIMKSENGPEHTVIDCEGDGRAFYFHSGERQCR